jgi:hypothetical protein
VTRSIVILYICLSLSAFTLPLICLQFRQNLLVWARHEKWPELNRLGEGTLCYTLSQEHQSTIMKRNYAYMAPCRLCQYHCQYQCHCCLYQSQVTCTNTQHVGDLEWVCMCETGIVFSYSILRIRIVTLSSRSSSSGDFWWRHNTKCNLHSVPRKHISLTL